jgi:hypothetical protein
VTTIFDLHEGHVVSSLIVKNKITIRTGQKSKRKQKQNDTPCIEQQLFHQLTNFEEAFQRIGFDKAIALSLSIQILQRNFFH